MKKRFLSLINFFIRRKINWKTLAKRGDQSFQLAWRLLLSFLVLGFLWFIIRGLQDNGYSIQAFNMPKSFVDAGYTGPIMARKLVDEIAEVQAFISSIKEDELKDLRNNNDKPDLDVEVMGIGLTLNSITFHLRELLGRPNRSIGGELTDIDQTLSLNLRITGAPVQRFTFNYADTTKSEALKYLTNEAAKATIKFLDPYRMAVYYQRKEDNPASLNIVNYILKEKPEDSDWAYMAWGNLLDQNDDLPGAAKKFEQATTINPNLAVAWRNWAWIEFRQRKDSNAIALMKRSLHYEKDNAETWNGLGYCLRQMGQYEEADKAYQKAIKLDPKNINWARNYAEFKGALGDTAAVIGIFDQAKKNIDPKGSEYFLAISNYYQFLDKFDSVALCLQNAHDLDPKNLSINNQLAIYYFNNDEREKGMKYAHQTLQLAKTSTANNANYIQLNIHNNIAMAHYEVAQYDSAYYHVHKAISFNPKIGFPYSTLAEIHGLVGNDDGFYEAIEMAMVRGFKVSPYLDQAPYDKYKEEARFRALVEKIIALNDN